MNVNYEPPNYLFKQGEVFMNNKSDIKSIANENIQDIAINEAGFFNDSDKLSALRKMLSNHIELLQKRLYLADEKTEIVSKELLEIRDSLSVINSEEKRKDVINLMMQKDTERNNHIYSKGLYREEISSLQLILKNTY